LSPEESSSGTDFIRGRNSGYTGKRCRSSKALEDHRVRQNGSLQRLEDKVEEIWKAQADSKNLLIVTFLSVIGSIIVAIIGK
jgi:hypothetical protein